MKTKLIILSLLIGLTGFSQKELKSYTKVGNNLVVTYIDEVGVEVSTASLNVNTASFEQLIKDSLDAMPKSMAAVTSVTLIDNTFTITGQHYSPFVKTYSQLTAEQKAVVDALKAKYNTVTGNTLTSLVTIFGSNKVTINGVEYDYATFAGEEFTNAIVLANTLFNR
jgi:hypothetical protein